MRRTRTHTPVTPLTTPQESPMSKIQHTATDTARHRRGVRASALRKGMRAGRRSGGVGLIVAGLMIIGFILMPFASAAPGDPGNTSGVGGVVGDVVGVVDAVVSPDAAGDPQQCDPGSAGCTADGTCIGQDYAPDDPATCGTPPSDSSDPTDGSDPTDQPSTGPSDPPSTQPSDPTDSPSTDPGDGNGGGGDCGLLGAVLGCPTNPSDPSDSPTVTPTGPGTGGDVPPIGQGNGNGNGNGGGNQGGQGGGNQGNGTPTGPTAGGGLSAGDAGANGVLPGVEQPQQKVASADCDPTVCQVTAPATTQAASAQYSASQQTPSSGAVLPNTGAPKNVVPLSALGIAFMAAGVLLVRRSRPARRRG